MRTHLGLTTEEAVARLQGDWAADVAAYDKIHRHVLHLSDLLCRRHSSSSSRSGSASRESDPDRPGAARPLRDGGSLSFAQARRKGFDDMASILERAGPGA